MEKLCPLLKEPCIEHKCKFYVHLLGNDPQTGKAIDKFDCAMAFIPILLIEGAQQSRQAGAAIESFRNEMVLTGQGLTKALTDAARLKLKGGNGEDFTNTR